MEGLSLDSAFGNGFFSGSVRQLLRSETTADHAEVDARLGGSIERGAAGYCEFLRLSAAAIYPLERSLVAAGVESILPDWDQRCRTPALDADLAEFGMTQVPVVRPPVLSGEARQFGVLYVLEGSRLGAKVLIRRLRQRADLPAPHALRYLRHGEGLPLWPTFLRRLEASEAVRRSPADAIARARTAFACFGALSAARVVS